MTANVMRIPGFSKNQMVCSIGDVGKILGYRSELGAWNYTVAKRLHQIPCAKCQYFTGNHHLKCTVQPCFALTEEAINCLDFCPQDRPV